MLSLFWLRWLIIDWQYQKMFSFSPIKKTVIMVTCCCSFNLESLKTVKLSMSHKQWQKRRKGNGVIDCLLYKKASFANLFPQITLSLWNQIYQVWYDECIFVVGDFIPFELSSPARNSDEESDSVEERRNISRKWMELTWHHEGTISYIIRKHWSVWKL